MEGRRGCWMVGKDMCYKCIRGQEGERREGREGEDAGW